MKLSGSRYTIEHVNGEDNHWADMVSRWPVSEVVVKVKAVRTLSQPSPSILRPLQDESFEWPSRQAVRDAQERYRDSQPELTDQREGLIYVEGKLWIPIQVNELLTRVLIVAHCGIQAHRGIQVMLNQLQRSYAIENMRELVTQFVNRCLLFQAYIKGGKLIRRPWSETETALKRNEVLHMDYISMGDSYGATKYVLVLKDELTHFCELIAYDSPMSDVAVSAILDWYKRFGLPAKWVPDNGTHFKSLIMSELATRLHGVQSFVGLCIHHG
ncbi:unnamed protein product [Phytophthora lilii]|uniref:Unnamed protein product n=1 Tax=Phytophthora lilii TaxID=2077276 RepID=A0A9W6X8Q6_9STRA|nr:unnamed protein product [Phytophthora lilii]